jgi:hypothetical protein
MVHALIVAASLASAVTVERTPLTNADLRLVVTARPRVMVGEFLAVRTTWTARHRIPLVVGGESVEVDGGRGFEPRGEGGELGVQCVFSAPESYAAGRSTVTEHLIGLEDRDVPADPDLSGLDRINASVGFVFDHPGRYRVRVRYDDAVSNVVDVEAVAPTGVDAELLEALRSRPIVLTSMASVEPLIRDEGAALVRRYGPRRLLRPYLRATQAPGADR